MFRIDCIRKEQEEDIVKIMLDFTPFLLNLGFNNLNPINIKF